MYDYNAFHYFYQITPTSGEYSFNSYSDSQTGTSYEAIQYVDRDGKVRHFWIKFSARERMYKFPKNQKIQVRINKDEIKKVSLYDYIKNFPFTEGSKYAYGAKPLIKEFNEVADAAIGVTRKKRRITAGNIVLEMTPESRAELAPLFGIHSDDPDVQFNRLLELADQDPEAFFVHYEAPDKQVRSLVKRAIKAGLIKEQGRAIVIDKDVLADEDEAVKYLLKDEVKLKALSANLKKLK